MLTALLILALVAMIAMTVGVVGYACNQGFFFWAVLGQFQIKSCFELIIGIIEAISNANNS